MQHPRFHLEAGVLLRPTRKIMVFTKKAGLVLGKQNKIRQRNGKETAKLFPIEKQPCCVKIKRSLKLITEAKMMGCLPLANG